MSLVFFRGVSLAVTYDAVGVVTSVNLLEGKSVPGISSFYYDLASLPGDSSVSIQFSQDTLSWYSASAALNGSTSLTTLGGAIISLAPLDWSGSYFYYRLTLNSTSDRTGSPVLNSIKLNYSGSAFSIGDDSNINIGVGSLGIGTSASRKLDVMDMGTSTVARFTNSSGNCTVNPTNTGLICSSDINLKKNITTLSNGEIFALSVVELGNNPDILTKLNFLTPVSYNWKTEKDDTAKHAGFIAQQVEQLFPDLVATDDKGFKALNYSGFVPYIIEGMQKQNSLLHGESEDLISQNNSTDTLNIIRNENRKDVAESLQGRIQNGLSILVDFISARITAIVGYFENIFAKNIKTDTLKAKVICMDKSNGGEICIDGQELERVFQNGIILPPVETPQTSVDETPSVPTLNLDPEPNESEEITEPTGEVEETPSVGTGDEVDQNVNSDNSEIGD